MIRLKYRLGLSFVEIFVATMLLGILVGPIAVTISSMGRATTSSIYEMMASHFASEILEQLRVLPVVAILESTGAASLAEIVPSLDIPAEQKEPGKINLWDQVFLMVSPMPEHIFQKRILTLQRESRSAGPTNVNVLKATVTIVWKVPGAATEKSYAASTFIMEP